MGLLVKCSISHKKQAKGQAAKAGCVQWEPPHPTVPAATPAQAPSSTVTSPSSVSRGSQLPL